MSDAPLVYVDVSEVNEGAGDVVRGLFSKLVEFVEANVPGAVTYGVYLDEDASEVTIIHLHRDSASLEQHLEAGREQFERFAGLVTLRSIRVYGEPSERAIEKLHAKARTLGVDDVAVRSLHAGFIR